MSDIDMSMVVAEYFQKPAVEKNNRTESAVRKATSTEEHKGAAADRMLEL